VIKEQYVVTLMEHLQFELHPRSEIRGERGMTCVMDHHTPIGAMSDYLEDHGVWIDSVKLNPGQLFADVERTRAKTRLVSEHGIPVQPSGAYLEIARIKGHDTETLKQLRDLGFTQVEVSASTSAARDTDEQARFAELARSSGFSVVGEVGKKWPEGDDTRRAPDQINVEETIRQMQAYLDAGVEKIYWEGHLLKLVMGSTPEEVAQKQETALAQIRPVVDAIGQEHIIFETSGLLAPAVRRLMYLWWIRFFGPDVNIANTKFADVAFLETMRRGIAPASGMGRSGDHPWIRSIDANDGVATERWWEEAD
jgi:phosphosulfolactate synthase (CoM biosynthesis protein A)